MSARSATRKLGRARAALAGSALAIALAVLVPAPAGRADVAAIGPVLAPAALRVSALRPQPPHSPIHLLAGIRDWHGALAHIAGTAHYDRGEWIYENYPYTAYGAASPESVPAIEALSAAGLVVPRAPAAVSLAQDPAGVGPLVDDADLWQLRVAVRGSDLYVLARTTAMHAPVRTALLLLFDTGRSGGVSRAVPFGSGLQTSHADAAALVTAAGTRVVDLVSGRTTSAPASADATGYVNSLETRLPLGLVGIPGRAQVRMVAATGLVTPGTYTLLGNGAAGPLAAVAPRFAEPVQTVYDRQQALALAGHDIDQFLTTISLSMLRHGVSQALRPGPGFSVRTFIRPAALSSEQNANGALQEYGVYVPRGFTGAPTPATLMLAGSGFTATEHPALEPNLFRQLGDENGAIMISVGSGYPSSVINLYEGSDYLLVDQALSDAERSMPIDPHRLTIAGYSMGGWGAFLFSATQPDRFAAAFSIEGVVSGSSQVTPPDATVPDLLPLLVNLRYTPIEIYQTAEDENVPVRNGLDAAQALRQAGNRYKLDIYQGDHYGPGIFDDYTYGQRMLRGATLVTDPSEVRFTRNMALEHGIDTGLDSDEPFKGHSVGLHFDHAWYVSRLDAADPADGTATIDVRTLARPAGAVTPVHSVGVDPGYNGEVPSPFDQQVWRVAPASQAPSNAFTAQLTGAAHVALDLPAMGIAVNRPLVAQVETDRTATVVLLLGRPASLLVSVDGSAAKPARGRLLSLLLGPGDHRVKIIPGSASRSNGELWRFL